MVGSQDLQSKVQLSLSDLLWITTALALLLAYAQAFGRTEVIQLGVYLGTSLLAGFTVGVCVGVVRDVLFWTGLCSLVVFVAVAGGTLPHEGVAMGWGVMAAACGSFASSGFPKTLTLAALVSGFLGGAAMLVTIVGMGESLGWLVGFDIMCAIAVGFLLPGFIRFLQWLETRTRQPRVVLAAWLSICFLVGNYLVPIVGGVIR
ncbi:MAG: hypothetical protein AB8B50_06715 [Pirellulaceae bacterium]